MKVTRQQLKAARQLLVKEYNVWSQLAGADNYECINREKQIKQITKALGS